MADSRCTAEFGDLEEARMAGRTQSKQAGKKQAQKPPFPMPKVPNTREHSQVILRVIDRLKAV